MKKHQAPPQATVRPSSWRGGNEKNKSEHERPQHDNRKKNRLPEQGKLTTTTAVAEKRRSTRRPGAAQDWRWARSTTRFSTRETSPTRGPATKSCPRGTLRRTSCPTRGPTTRSFPHGALMNECLTRELTTRSCPCGTLMNERLHAGANYETLPMRGTRYDQEPKGPHRVGLRGHPRRRPRRRRRRPRRR